MMITTRFFTIFVTLVALGGGCAVQNEDYCADDSDCLALGQVCHDEGHFCHEACVKDADCADPARPGYLASRPFCDPGSGDCVAGGTDGGLPDAPVPIKKNGTACGGDGECLSSHCVGSVCCDKACDQASTCTDGKVTGPSCVTGTCEIVSNPCHGYACNAAKDACRVDCSVKTHCTGTFECVGTECVNSLANGAFCGTNDKACLSGLCVDQTCCDKACGALCESCNLTGNAGTCTAVSAGNDPDGDCQGTSAACNGSCDGAGACSYPGASQTCGTLSCSVASLTTPVCNGKGECVDQKTSCSPYICDSGGKACTLSCADHTKCFKTSACDRSGADADPKGLGICVDTKKIITVGASEEISAALTKVTTSKPYVVIPPKTYKNALTISGKVVHLIGKGGTSSNPVKLDPDVTGPALVILDSATVSIQGLTIDGATGTTGNGVQCSATSSKSKLSIIESQIRNNTEIGVTSSGCDVTIRRSEISDNDGGGALLAKGDLALVNNIVVKNGDNAPGGSSFGGLDLSGATKLTFTNNTVAYNNALVSGKAGVLCATAHTLRNSIVWANVPGAQLSSSCKAAYSDVQGSSTGTGMISVDPKLTALFKPQEPKCFNSGLSTAAGVSSIDLANGLRIKGSAIDMGAYEIK